MTDQRTLVERLDLVLRGTWSRSVVSLADQDVMIPVQRTLLREAADAIEQAEARIAEEYEKRMALARATIAQYNAAEARLRKAERLAEAAERAIEFCDDDEHHGLVLALRTFRNTEDAK